jgi:hypothetical protein
MNSRRFFLFVIVLTVLSSVNLAECDVFAVDPYALVKDAELVVTAEFKNYADTDYFGLFEAKTIHKGKLEATDFVIYLSDSMISYLHEFQPNIQFLFLLNERKDVDLSVRKRFDESNLRTFSLFAPVITRVSYAVFNLTNQSENERAKIERYIWMAELQSREGKDREEFLMRSVTNNNTSISESSEWLLARDIESGMSQYLSPEQKARLYASLLDTTTNRFLEQYTLRFFAEYHYDPALPIMVRRFENTSDDQPIAEAYIQAFKNHPAPAVASAIMSRLVGWDYKYQWKYDGSTGHALYESLGDTADAVFGRLLREFEESIDESLMTRYTPTLVQMLSFFTPYASAERTAYLKKIWLITQHRGILETMASGGESSAITFLLDTLIKGNYRNDWIALRTFRHYSDSQVGGLLIEIIQTSIDRDVRNAAYTALSHVLSNTEVNNVSPATVAFIKSLIAYQRQLDANNTELPKIIDILASAKTAEITCLIAEEIKRTSDTRKKSSLIGTLVQKDYDLTHRTLKGILFNKSEDLEVRQAALWTLARSGDNRAYDIIYEFVSARKISQTFRREATRRLLEKKYGAAAKAHIALIKEFKSWQELSEWNHQAGGFRYLNAEHLSLGEREELDDYLAKLYSSSISKLSPAERFELIHTFRQWCHGILKKLFIAAGADHDAYVREEAAYGLAEYEQAQKQDTKSY